MCNIYSIVLLCDLILSLNIIVRTSISENNILIFISRVYIGGRGKGDFMNNQSIINDTTKQVVINLSINRNYYNIKSAIDRKKYQIAINKLFNSKNKDCDLIHFSKYAIGEKPTITNNFSNDKGKKRKTFKPYYKIVKLDNTIIISVITEYHIKAVRVVKTFKKVISNYRLLVNLKTYDLFYDYMLSVIDNMTRKIILKIASFQKVIIDKDGKEHLINDPCQEACLQLIKNNFKEAIFEDLKQELLTHFITCYDDIKINECALYPFDLGENYIKGYKVIRNYLYRNKQRDNNKLYIEKVTDDGDQLTIIDASGKYYTIENNVADNVISNIENSIMDYASLYFTSKTCKNIKLVLPLMIKGYTQKQIAEKTNLSIKTIERITPTIKELYSEIKSAQYNDKGEKDTIKHYKKLVAYKLEKADTKTHFFNPYIVTQKHNNPCYNIPQIYNFNHIAYKTRGEEALYIKECANRVNGLHAENN